VGQGCQWNAQYNVRGHKRVFCGLCVSPEVSREKVKDKRRKVMDDLPIQDNQCLLKMCMGEEKEVQVKQRDLR
jgi:hypothetical protein